MDYYDYDEPDDFDSNEYDRYPEHMEGQQSWIDIFRGCVLPSVQQVTLYLSVLIAGNLLCRVLWYAAKNSRIRHWINHYSSIACGFVVLYLTIGHEFLIVLFLCLLAYALILIIEYLKYKSVGIIVMVATISVHIICEFLGTQPETWQRIRGVQMVATMKVISLGFDLEDSGNGGTKAMHHIKSVPALVPYLGYIFCPSTCVLGPWISYKCYVLCTQKVNHGYRWIMWTTLNILFSLSFLCMSNCIASLLCSDNSWKWLVAYRDALSVRCSHYFISFVSQATLSTGGVSTSLVEEPSILFGHMVTKPWSIEVPRSLSSSVRSWNIPMHNWLKYYIFRSLRKQYVSYPLALICTYIVSSLLHGLHLKIYIVLISLSCFAYVERVVRLKLANVFNACISANPCKKPCIYAVCPSHNQWQMALSVWLINLVFSICAILNLAYLGIILSNSTTVSVDDPVEKFDIVNDVHKWANLNYLSHWIAALAYLFYNLV